MKIQLLTGVFSALLTMTTMAQSNDANEIKNMITAFSKAADENNVEELEKYLDSNYQVAMNRLFGSNAVVIMPRAVYVDKIRSKEFGGDKRVVTFQEIVLNGNTASAKVTYIGSKMTFISLYTLVKDDKNQWKLIGDLPIVQ